MKKSKLYITGAVLAAVGAAVLAGSVFAGGRPGFVIDVDGFRLGDNRKNFVREKTELEDFSSAKLYLEYSDLEIVPSDTFALEYGFYGQSYEPETEVKDGVLIFRETPRKNTLQVQFCAWGSVENKQNYVRLYVPEDTSLEELLVENETGDVSIEGITADSLTINADYGNVRLKSVEMLRGDVQVETGDFSGDKLEAKELRIENEYGDVKLSFVEDPKVYTMDLWTEYGEIDVPDGGTLLREDGEERYTSEGTENKTLSVFCESGDIIID